MARPKLLSGTRVSELTGLHKVTLQKLVQEEFLERDACSLTYSGTEAVVAKLLGVLGTRASKPDSERDREAVNVLREALLTGNVQPRTDLVLSAETCQLVNTAGELFDATSYLRHYRVLGVGAWLNEYRSAEPEAFPDQPALITAAAVA